MNIACVAVLAAAVAVAGIVVYRLWRVYVEASQYIDRKDLQEDL